MVNTIVHVVYSLHVGGLERVLINTVKRMPSNYNHVVVCLTNYSEAFASLLPDNVEILTLNKSDGHDWGVYKQWWAVLRKVRPDVVHTYNLATLELQVFAFLARVPVRLHAEHGRDIYDPTGSNKKYQWLRRIVSPFLHKWVTVSGELDEWLRSTVAISPQKIVLIRNGIDTEIYKPNNKQSGDFVLGHVGRLSPIKNQALLISAFSKACKLDSDFAKGARLQIAGEGESEQSLVTQVRNLSLLSHIEFLGLKSDMPAIYNGFSVFVMSSLAEGIPMTLLEAMACGLPSIVTAVGGMPEVITPDSGVLVSSEDVEGMAKAMILLFNDRQRCERLSENARNRIIEKFDEANMVEAYLQLYNQ